MCYVAKKIIRIEDEELDDGQEYSYLEQLMTLKKTMKMKLKRCIILEMESN